MDKNEMEGFPMQDTITKTDVTIRPKLLSNFKESKLSQSRNFHQKEKKKGPQTSPEMAIHPHTFWPVAFWLILVVLAHGPFTMYEGALPTTLFLSLT